MAWWFNGVIAAVCLLACALVHSQAALPEPPPPLYETPTRADRIGRILVPVKVNEQGPFRFVLDTGSGMSVISDTTAKRLGLRPIARGGMARAVGGAGRFEIVYGHNYRWSSSRSPPASPIGDS